MVLDLEKRLNKVAQRRGGDIINRWKPSIIRHLYYVADYGNGNPNKNEQMWRALGNHIVNEHVHPDLPLFSKCCHSTIEEPRAWMDPGNFNN